MERSIWVTPSQHFFAKLCSFQWQVSSGYENSRFLDFKNLILLWQGEGEGDIRFPNYWCECFMVLWYVKQNKKKMDKCKRPSLNDNLLINDTNIIIYPKFSLKILQNCKSFLCKQFCETLTYSFQMRSILNQKMHEISVTADNMSEMMRYYLLGVNNDNDEVRAGPVLYLSEMIKFQG